MTELVMLEASLFQLQAAMRPELELAVSVLANAIARARDELNAARARDIEFALNDVAEAADNLSAADADVVLPILDAMRADVAALKAATPLPANIVAVIGTVRARLTTRRDAIERRDGSSASLGPTDELSYVVLELRADLARAGFDTPALDAFLARPETLPLHIIVDILDELEVIAT